MPERVVRAGSGAVAAAGGYGETARETVVGAAGAYVASAYVNTANVIVVIVTIVAARALIAGVTRATS